MPRGRPRKDSETRSDSEDRVNPERTAGRTSRKPLGAARLKLQAENRPGYVRRWINDRPGRLYVALDAGYEYVKDPRARDQEERVRVQAGVNEAGEPMFAYLMEIKEEFYREDQALKMQALDEFDAAIKRGVPTGVADGERGNFYQPTQGVTVRHG